MDTPGQNQDQPHDQPQSVGQIFSNRAPVEREPAREDRISPTARLYPNVRLGQNVVIEDYCIIGKPGRGAAAGAEVTVIGDNAVIRSHTVIYAGNRIGNNFQTGHHVLIREQNEIGNNVSIGSYSDIEHHITIEDYVRIHSKVFVPEYTVLKANAWIGPGVMMTDAAYPRSVRVKEQLKGPTIEASAKVGAGAIVLPAVTVGSGALVGAGSLVTHDIPPGMVAFGSPAKPIKPVSELRYRDTGELVYPQTTEQQKQKKHIPLVDLHAQYLAIKPDIDAAISRVIAHSAFIQGEEVEGFEREFAEFCGMRYCVGVSSGTSALELTLKVLGIGPGDEVITTPLTFIATAEAIINVGAVPKFVDIDEQTYNLDPRFIESAITPRTKVILPVHLYGQPADMLEIYQIARRSNLFVIEDAAQGHGAEVAGHRVPLQIGAFSFYPGKNLGAYGDAGAIVLNDENLTSRLKSLRDHGRISKYEHTLVATSARLDGLQAAILRAKLPYLPAWIKRRRELAHLYTQSLQDLPVLVPYEDGRGRHAYHLYVIRLAARDQLAQYLQEAGISTGIHYPVPLHLQPVYQYLGYRAGDFPVAERVAGEILSLPLYPELGNEQVSEICNQIRGFFVSGVREA